MYLSTAISRTTWKNLQKIGVPLQDETLCHSLAVCAATYKKRRIQVLQVSSAQQPTDHVLSFDRRPWEIQVHTLQTPNHKPQFKTTQSVWSDNASPEINQMSLIENGTSNVNHKDIFQNIVERWPKEKHHRRQWK